jgi:PAS domain S-box-containing protein
MENGIGKVLWDLFPGAKELSFYQEYVKAFETGRTVHFEEYFPPLKLWFEITVYPTGDFLSIYIRDITKRKSTEKALQEVNERYEYVSKATSQAIWDWEIGSQKAYWYGENYKKLFGYDIKDQFMECILWRENIHPTDRERIMQKHWDAVLNGKENWSDHYWFLKKDGTYAYVKDRAYILRDNQGKAIRMIGAMDDITAQKLAEEAVIESEDRYRILFENAPQPHIIFDKETLQLLDANEEAIKHYGYSREELMNMTLLNLKPIKDHAITIKMIKKEKVKGTYKGTWTHIKKNGEEIIVEIKASPIFYKGRQAKLFAVNDITETVKLEEKVSVLRIKQQKQITAAVIKAQERERSQLGQDLHDNVNQVLTTVKLYNEMHIAGIGKDNELISKSINYLQTCINEIRSISKRLSAPTLGKICLNESIRELIASINLAKKIKIDYLASNLENFCISEEYHLTVYRIVQEQLNNILKHSGATQVKIYIKNKSNFLLLIIRDNGKGFDLSSKRSGIGITNMISRAESSKGKLYIQSAPGKGCTLKAVLPSLKQKKFSSKEIAH